MRKLLLPFLLLLVGTSFAQVGIGTTTPQGALDITSSTNGLVLPRIALTATNVALPVVNPQGGALVNGTMIYNTNTTTGTNGVTPGVYFWDGAKWNVQGQSAFNVTFTQTSMNQIYKNATTPTQPSGGYVNINGLTANTFIAPYSGNYRIIFLGYLGANQSANINKVGKVEGVFKFTFNSVDYLKYIHSENFDTYLELFNEVTIIIDVNLIAGTTYTLNAAFDGVNSDNITSPENVVGRVPTASAPLSNVCSTHINYTGK